MRSWLDILFPPRADETIVRHIIQDGFLALSSPHLTGKTHPDTVALLPFSTSSVRAAIHEAKYHGSKQAFCLLAHTLADYLREADDTTIGVRSVYLVPVPLGALRRKERGYNQVEEIANRALHMLDGFTLDTTMLTRARETTSQVSLPRSQRTENVRGAFKATRPADPLSTYIVLDDVLTTGATLQAVIDALSTAGATQIIPLALAH